MRSRIVVRTESVHAVGCEQVLAIGLEAIVEAIAAQIDDGLDDLSGDRLDSALAFLVAA